MKNRIFVITFLIMFLFSTMVFGANNSERIEVKYVKTSDGDTARFVVDGENIRVRFLGINTPEVSGEDKVEEPYGNEALEYTKNKLDNAKKIEIEYDDVADKEDRFGRKLAWIWVDDELYELELLEKGLAKTYMLKNNYKYAKELKASEQKAKDNKIGVWSEEENTTSQNMETSQNKTEINNKEESKNENKNSNETENEFGVVSYLVVVIIIAIILYFLKNKK